MRAKLQKCILATLSLLGIASILLVWPNSSKREFFKREVSEREAAKVISFKGEHRLAEDKPKNETGEKRWKDIPRVIILWTSWRSGSTFLGHLLASAVPKTFFSTEPLHKAGIRILQKDDIKTTAAWKYLLDLLHCQITQKYKQILDHMRAVNYYMLWNTYLSSNCLPNERCTDPDFVSQLCRNASIHLAKVIRFPLKRARTLLNDETLDIQIIYLVRDPRAVMMSRLKYPWWCQDKSCSDPKTVCDLFTENLKVADELQEMFPGKFRIYQYERVNKNPNRGLNDIMTFLNLPVSQAQLETLKPNNTEQEDFYSIKKNATVMVDAWRSKNPFEIIHYIQDTCAKVISKLGLRFFESESELRNLSLPLIVSDAS